MSENVLRLSPFLSPLVERWSRRVAQVAPGQRRTLRLIDDRIAEVKANGDKPVLLFDIDNTLCVPIERSRHALKVMLSVALQSTQDGPTRAKLSSALAEVNKQKLPLYKGPSLDRYFRETGLEALPLDCERLRRVYYDEFSFSPSLMDGDLRMPGAARQLRRWEKQGAEVHFVTARSDQHERALTERWLAARPSGPRRWASRIVPGLDAGSIPVGEGRLRMHPEDTDLAHDEMKAVHTTDILRGGRKIVAVFDDLAENRNAFVRAAVDKQGDKPLAVEMTSGPFLAESARPQGQVLASFLRRDPLPALAGLAAIAVGATSLAAATGAVGWR